MKTYQITLPDEFAEFMDRMVSEGKFDSADHLVLYAVSQVEDEMHRDEAIDLDELRRQIRGATEQSARGEVAPLDMPAIRKRAMERLAAEKEQAHVAGNADRPG